MLSDILHEVPEAIVNEFCTLGDRLFPVSGFDCSFSIFAVVFVKPDNECFHFNFLG
jgi:hypothetical protein|tara:strand:- start:181 stop:348 length:168 start_codon:yes stop_codon:yes gene_type:complete